MLNESLSSTQLQKQSLLSKDVWIGLFSSMIEAYNMAVYSFAAPFLASTLFKDAQEWNAVFFSYSLVLIASMIMYPLGAIYFGVKGDKPDVKTSLEDYKAKLAAITLCDEEGKRILDFDDYKKLGECISSKRMEKIIKVAQELNKISKEDQDEMLKN